MPAFPAAFISALFLVTGAESRAFAPKARLSLRVATGAEWDTNPPRAVDTEVQFLPDASRPASGDVAGDGLVRVLVDTSLDVTLTKLDRARLFYLLGAKRFFEQDAEDLLVHELGVSSGHRLLPGLSVEASATWRQSHIRSSNRDYAIGLAGGALRVRLAKGLSAAVGGRYTAFDFLPVPGLGHAGPRLTADLSWRPARRFAIRGAVEHAWLHYAMNALAPIIVRDANDRVHKVYTFCDGSDGIEPPDCVPRSRDDTELSVGLSASYRGPIIVGGEVRARLRRSTSALEDIDRYRLSAYATIPLPGALILQVMGAVQLNDGLSVTQAKYLAEDDENQNRVEVQLSRKLGGAVSVEARYSLFANEFATAAAHFIRQTAYLGLSVQLPGDETPRT